MILDPLGHLEDRLGLANVVPAFRVGDVQSNRSKVGRHLEKVRPGTARPHLVPISLGLGCVPHPDRLAVVAAGHILLAAIANRGVSLGYANPPSFLGLHVRNGPVVLLPELLLVLLDQWRGVGGGLGRNKQPVLVDRSQVLDALGLDLPEYRFSPLNATCHSS